MDEIRSWWQVPCIAHFCSLFRTAFALTDFEIEDLEDALMISGGQEESRFLADLHARLLRGLFSKKADINADNFEPYLSEVLKVRWVDDSKLNRKNPLETASYKDLSIWEKVEILHSLCDWRLDCDDVPDHLKGMEASSLRVEPLGRDCESNTYWYFYGTRLYKECIETTEKRTKTKKQRVKKKRKKKFKKKKKIRKQWSSGSESTTTSESESSTEQDEYELDDDTGDDDIEYKRMSSGDGAETKRAWSLVCSTNEEWEALAEAFASSHNKDEKNMYETLTVDFLAEISRMLEAKDKAFRKKLLVEMAPRRSSDRIAIKAQQKEEEDKLAEIEKQQEKERLAEIKKQEAEAKEKERQILSEKRQRERAERARLREERQWLIMSGGEVSEEILQSLEKNGEIRDVDENDEKKLDELDKAFEGDVDMFTGMYKVLDALRNHEDGWPFLEPVEESYAPNYFEIITNPMDLSTIEKKIDAKEYKGLKEFISDVKLMFKNCLEYNGETSCYTQMARTLENVFERQMKKHFPDDDNQSSDEDFEEELTESELRKLNKKKSTDANGMEDLVKAADIHRSNQKPTLDPRFKDPAMFARHFGMNPMANNVTRMMQDPMGFQRMPYMRQPFYPSQMYPGHPAFARFNMHDFPRGAPPMFSPMMGLGHPAMRMNPQTAGQFSNPDVSSGMVRGVAPVATKGEASASMWTNNLIQDNRGMGRPYPPHRLTSPNTPWQTPAGVLPDGRQMLAGWRPPTAMSNGVTSVSQVTSSERTHEPTEQKQSVSNDDRAQELLNDRKDSGNTLQPDKDSSKDDIGGSDHTATGPMKVPGNQPSEEDLRFPFIMGQSRPSNESRTGTHPSISANSSTVSKLPNPNRVEGVESPVGGEGQRVKTPPVTLESDEGKVFINLSSKVNQPRVGDKRSNPYSVSSLMSNEEQQSKRSAHEQLKFSTLLQEMSQGRKPEHLGHPRTNDGQFMDLNTTRNHIPPSLIRQQQAERGVGVVPPSEPQAHPPTYPNPVDGIQSPLNRGVPASFMNMRSPGDMLAQERSGFNTRTMYPGYSSHGEFQRQQMMLLQQQQMMQRHHMAGSMMANGMPRNMPPEYAYLAQRPMFDAMMGQYKNGTRAPNINDLTGKKPRVS